LPPHDVVYFSGFTPDEQRRASMVHHNGAAFWQPQDKPFHPVVMDYAAKIKKGGLLLIQSYCGGVDTTPHVNDLETCRLQLERAGFHLVEVHRYAHTRGVMLYAAVRGKGKQGDEPIAMFHGRGDPEPIERIYPTDTRKGALERLVSAVRRFRTY